MLSLIGAALGGGVGAAILSAAPSLIPQGLLPATVTLTFDTSVVAFCAGAAVLVGLVFGVMPAWKGRLDPVTIKMLAAYVHSRGGGQQAAPAAPAADATGDVAAAKKDDSDG